MGGGCRVEVKSCLCLVRVVRSVLTVVCCLLFVVVFFFFFTDTATTEIYTLSLHDALPIYPFCVRRSRT